MTSLEQCSGFKCTKQLRATAFVDTDQLETKLAREDEENPRCMAAKWVGRQTLIRVKALLCHKHLLASLCAARINDD